VGRPIQKRRREGKSIGNQTEVITGGNSWLQNRGPKTGGVYAGAKGKGLKRVRAPSEREGIERQKGVRSEGGGQTGGEGRLCFPSEQNTGGRTYGKKDEPKNPEKQHNIGRRKWRGAGKHLRSKKRERENRGKLS